MERTEYSEDGWLADYRFRGMYTKDLTVVTPAGPCAPSARHFIVSEDTSLACVGLEIIVPDVWANIPSSVNGSANKIKLT